MKDSALRRCKYAWQLAVVEGMTYREAGLNMIEGGYRQITPERVRQLVHKYRRYRYPYLIGISTVIYKGSGLVSATRSILITIHMVTGVGIARHEGACKPVRSVVGYV